MANNCTTNWNIVGQEKTLSKIIDILKTLFEKKPIGPSDFGITWLGNLYAHIYGTSYEEIICSPHELRGFILPEFYECNTMEKQSPGSDMRFTVFQTAREGLFQIRLSTETAWSRPDWFGKWLETFRTKDKTFDYGFRTTDECGNFFSCFNPELMQYVYFIDSPYFEEYRIGEEEDYVKKIEEITGLSFDREPIRRKDFSQLQEKLDNYNDTHEDNECYVQIYEQILS